MHNKSKSRGQPTSLPTVLQSSAEKKCLRKGIRRSLFTSLKFLALVMVQCALWEVAAENDHSSPDKGLKRDPGYPSNNSD